MAASSNVDDAAIQNPGGAFLAEQEAKPTTKSGRTLWTPQKAEPTIAAANGRPAAAAPSPLGSTTAAQQLTERQAQLIGLAPSGKMQQPQTNGVRSMAAQGQGNNDPPALLVLLPMNGTFERKQITVPYFPDILRIGRQTNKQTIPTPVNGYFDSKVLSRQHAEVWADRTGKIWIRDVKSSNGTFVNGVRLSPESRDSEPHELRDNDMLELGIDIVSEDQKSIVHHKVSAKIEHAGIQASPSSVLDLNLGDIDPGSGGGVMGGMSPAQQHMRGRGGSLGSVGSNGRMSVQSMNSGVNGIGVQRHMNAWLSPVSIEQVVKRLGVSAPLPVKLKASNSSRTNSNKPANKPRTCIAQATSFRLCLTPLLGRSSQSRRQASCPNRKPTASLQRRRQCRLSHNRQLPHPKLRSQKSLMPPQAYHTMAVFRLRRTKPKMPVARS